MGAEGEAVGEGGSELAQPEGRLGVEGEAGEGEEGEGGLPFRRRRHLKESGTLGYTAGN